MRASVTYRILGLALGLAGLVLLPACEGTQNQSGTANGKKLVEVSVFQGGYDIDFWEACARQYEETHPEVKVNLWGDPRNAEKLRPRFIAGNPPDLVYASLPIWILIAADQCLPLDEELAKPAVGQPGKTWKESLIPSAYTDFSQDGHTYALTVPYAVFGFWYDHRLFRAHGWQPPETWDDLLALCEQIKQAGIDPIAFQGRYPGYIQSLFETLVERTGGIEAWLATQNIEPGVWKSEPVVRAWEMVQELRRREYIPKAYMGLSHMESQMEWVQGKAAMIPCGTWLTTEMKSSLPKEFEVGFMPYPGVSGGKGDPTAINAGGEYWFVPTKARHPDIGADILRQVMSLDNARRFVQDKKALFAVRNCDDNPPAALKEAVAAAHSARFMFSSHVSQWYPTFGSAYNEVCGSVMSLDMTPQEAGDYLERAAAAQRRDRRTRRHEMPNPDPFAAAYAAVEALKDDPVVIVGW